MPYDFDLTLGVDTPPNFTYNTPVAENESDADKAGIISCSKTSPIIGIDQFSDDLDSSLNLNDSGVASQLDDGMALQLLERG
jgi:hypothetical protein